MRIVGLTLSVLLAGCGVEGRGVVEATARPGNGATLLGASLSVWVLAPRLSDQTLATCSQLVSQGLLPDESRTEELARVDMLVISTESQIARMQSISEGAGRIVYVETYDASKNLLESGCTEGVAVEPDETSAVDVALFAI